MVRALPEPTDHGGDLKGRLLDYLDYYRSTVAAKLDGLDEGKLRTVRMPSGWAPIELLAHLVHMERRWLQWGFTAEQVDAPWGDVGPDGRWRVGADESLTELLAMLRDGGERTRAIVEQADLDDAAAVGGRFEPGSTPPRLAWILLHVLQEYARHVGHLDIARELADGEVGE